MSLYYLHRNNVCGSAEPVQISIKCVHDEGGIMIDNKYDLERVKRADKDNLEMRKLDEGIERILIEEKCYEERKILDCNSRNESELERAKDELETQKEKMRSC